LLIAFCAAGASAQEAYPSKPLTMVVPFPPGGVADIVGRPLAAGMNHALKQPVVVINRTGAGGAVGMASVARAAADGYTLLMSLSSISIFPVSDRINGKPPAYELKDFAPVALVTADPTVLVVRADSRYKTLKDFVDAAQANPGKINYSSSGVYGTLHVAMEIFANAAGIRLFHVPYQGGGPAPTVAKLRDAVREVANSAEFKSAMEKVETPVHYLDAPDFKRYWERDAARLKLALEKIGKVEEK